MGVKNKSLVSVVKCDQPATKMAYIDMSFKPNEMGTFDVLI